MKAYMALAYKKGALGRVLDNLIKMNLTQQDVFLLLGPFDILVQLRELANLDEFISKWFDPIRTMTPTEPLIEKTQTLIVISEGKSFTEQPYAFLFFNTQPRNLEQVQQDLQSIPQVLSAETVFGLFDVICAVRARDQADLIRLISQIQEKVPNIQGIVTAIAAPLY
jgi:hypothetical protein